MGKQALVTLALEGEGNENVCKYDKSFPILSIPVDVRYIEYLFRESGFEKKADALKEIEYIDELVSKVRNNHIWLNAHNDRGSYSPSVGDMIFIGEVIYDVKKVGIVISNTEEDGLIYAAIENNVAKKFITHIYSKQILGYVKFEMIDKEVIATSHQGKGIGTIYVKKGSKAKLYFEKTSVMSEIREKESFELLSIDGIWYKVAYGLSNNGIAYIKKTDDVIVWMNIWFDKVEKSINRELVAGSQCIVTTDRLMNYPDGDRPGMKMLKLSEKSVAKVMQVANNEALPYNVLVSVNGIRGWVKEKDVVVVNDINSESNIKEIYFNENVSLYETVLLNKKVSELPRISARSIMYELDTFEGVDRNISIILYKGIKGYVCYDKQMKVEVRGDNDE